MDPTVAQPLFDIYRINIVFAGIASGIVGTCFGHPLDLIKVRLQARSEYKGSWDVFAQTWRNDGLPGLFRGIGSPLFGSSLLNVVAFSSYSLFNDLQLEYKLKHASETDPPPRLINHNFALSGLGVGLCCAPVVCPIEVVKVRMQLDQGKKGLANLKDIPRRQYKGSWDCFKKIWKTEGFFGLYTGFSSTTFRDVSYSATYFSVYEPLKQFLKANLTPEPDPNSPSSSPPGFSPLPIILSGGTSGALAWTAALPFDCAKTLIQQDSANAKKVTNWSILRRHYAEHGVRGFYSGWIPTILRAFAVSAIRFLTYESSLFTLNNFWKTKLEKAS